MPRAGTFEAATDAIRAELAHVLASDQAGLEPYVGYPDGGPLDQWRELNRSRRWSAYFLWNQGAAQPPHVARCPRTAEAVKAAPQCDIARHGPNVFFSILEPREWIPGRAWVFDDTIEHEAWNDSDTPRAILIFDVWNPYLSVAARDLVRAATEAVGSYYGAPPPGLV